MIGLFIRRLAVVLLWAVAGACVRGRPVEPFNYDRVRGSDSSPKNAQPLRQCVTSWSRSEKARVARERVFSFLATQAPNERGKAVLVEMATLSEVVAPYAVAIFIDGRAVRGVIHGQPQPVEVTHPRLADALAHLTPSRLNQVHGQEKDGYHDIECCFVSVWDRTGLSQVGFTPCFDSEASAVLPGAWAFLDSVDDEPRAEGHK
jgi:hypothetical protein